MPTPEKDVLKPKFGINDEVVVLKGFCVHDESGNSISEYIEVNADNDILFRIVRLEYDVFNNVYRYTIHCNVVTLHNVRENFIDYKSEL